MAGILGLLMSGAGLIKDQYFNLTTLLLPGNGTNGAQNNSLLDTGNPAEFTATIAATTMTVSAVASGTIKVGMGITGTGVTAGTTVTAFVTGSGGAGTYTVSSSQTVSVATTMTSTGFPITRNGNTTQGTFSPFSQTGWGNYFDGNGDYLSATANTAFDFGTGDFTIEAWVYTDGTTETFGKRVVNKYVSNGWLFEVLRTSGNTVRFLWVNSSNVTVADIGTNDAFTAFTWHHIAVSRSGANISLYVDGSRKATSSSVSGGTDNVSNNLLIGSANLADTHFDGYISNARLVKGTAVYDPTLTSITVPTAPLTAITNTSLLTCQSNRFRDASNNNFPITRNGDTSVVAFSPFAPTQSYSAAAVGGSGYFDGTGDYLSVADNTAINIGTSDFQIGFWIYPTAFAGSAANVVFSKGTNNIVVLFNNSGTLSVGQYGVATRVTSSSNITLNQWA